MNIWSDFYSRWNLLFPKYSNKEESRTISIKNQLLAIIKECKDIDKSNNLLNKIASSDNKIIPDLEVFHIKKGLLQDNSYTISITPMKEKVFASFDLFGGGDIKIKWRTIKNNGKPSIIDGANCVQYAYQVGGDSPSSAAAKGLIKDVSTHASFILRLGPENSEKKLYIFFRWYNTKHPQLAGPWSSIQTTLIL